MSPATPTTAPRADAPPRIARPHRWLLLIPFVWQVACVPLVNDLAWRPFGLPFPMVWQMAGILIATALIAIVFHIDRAHPEFAADAPEGVEP